MEPVTSVGELEASVRTETIVLPARLHPSGEPAPRIPDYRFVKVIGRGAFGTVWLAEETLAGVFRAIKVLHAARTRTPKPTQQEQQAVSRLQRELDGVHAYQAAAKEHPHLVRILKVGLCKVAGAEKPSSVGRVSRPVNPEERSAVCDQRSADETPAAQAGARIPSRTQDGGILIPRDRTPEGIPAEPETRLLTSAEANVKGEQDSRSSEHTAAYYVMEIADHAGGAQPHLPADYRPLTLATLLRQKGRLPCQSPLRESSLVRESLLAPTLAGIPSRASASTPLGVVECSLALLDAIEHLHKSGLQHRDIKSTNVLFIGGMLKLADMGLTASDDVDETVGTPGYLPPPDKRAESVASPPPDDEVASAPGRREYQVRPFAESPPMALPAATPPPADSPPVRRFGRPDDLYALGKVMYEMLTGLPAAAFPEWPADLDPASDPLLPRLRGLVNELCHPAAGRRLARKREVRLRLSDLISPSRAGTVCKRAMVRWLVLVGITGLAIGWLGREFVYQAYRPTGFAKRVGKYPYSGGVSATRSYEGELYEINRLHQPGQVFAVGEENVTLGRFADVQTSLADGYLVVAGAYQIYNICNAGRGDVTVAEGEVDQVWLIVGDGPDAVMECFYDAEPGAKPGAEARFRRFARLADVRQRLPRDVEHPVYLGFSNVQTSEGARWVWRTGRTVPTFRLAKIGTLRHCEPPQHTSPAYLEYATPEASSGPP